MKALAHGPIYGDEPVRCEKEVCGCNFGYNFR